VHGPLGADLPPHAAPRSKVRSSKHIPTSARLPYPTDAEANLDASLECRPVLPFYPRRRHALNIPNNPSHGKLLRADSATDAATEPPGLRQYASAPSLAIPLRASSARFSLPVRTPPRLASQSTSRQAASRCLFLRRNHSALS
jgi:hypothetical protein